MSAITIDLSIWLLCGVLGFSAVLFFSHRDPHDIFLVALFGGLGTAMGFSLFFKYRFHTTIGRKICSIEKNIQMQYTARALPAGVVFVLAFMSSCLCISIGSAVWRGNVIGWPSYRLAREHLQARNIEVERWPRGYWVEGPKITMAFRAKEYNRDLAVFVNHRGHSEVESTFVWHKKREFQFSGMFGL